MGDLLVSSSAFAMSARGRPAPPPPRRQSFSTRGPPQIGSRPPPPTQARSTTPPAPAVVGPPPMPAVVGPPPVPTGYTSSNSISNIAVTQAPATLPKAATQPELPVYNEPPQPQRKKTKVAAISSSPWFPFIELLLRDNQIITRSVMNILKRSDTDLLAHAMVNVFSTTGHIFKFLLPVIEDEVETTENSGTLFRGNCLASKILSSYSVSVGKDFLKQLLEGPINSVIVDGDKYEVNPLKLSNSANLDENIQNLRQGLQTFMEAILQSISYCPLVIRKICVELRNSIAVRFPQSLYSVVGGFFFLRFVCPAIVSPEGFGVMDKVPNSGRRPLILISKILQNLGNGVQFGKKEEYMAPLNDLILHYLPLIQQFFDELTVLPPGQDIDTPPVPVDNALLEKFHKVTVYAKDRIMETISAYETAYDLPVGSETNLFTQVLNFLEMSKAADPPSKQGKGKGRRK